MNDWPVALQVLDADSMGGHELHLILALPTQGANALTSTPSHALSCFSMNAWPDEVWISGTTVRLRHSRMMNR